MGLQASPISLSWCVEDFLYFTGDSFERNPRTHVLSGRKDPSGAVKSHDTTLRDLRKPSVSYSGVSVPMPLGQSLPSLCPSSTLFDAPTPVIDPPRACTHVHAPVSPPSRSIGNWFHRMVSGIEELGRAPLALVTAPDRIPDAPIASPYQTSECTSWTLSSISTTVIRCSAGRQGLRQTSQ